jgi:hypothetical protein
MPVCGRKVGGQVKLRVLRIELESSRAWAATGVSSLQATRATSTSFGDRNSIALPMNLAAVVTGS